MKTHHIVSLTLATLLAAALTAPAQSADVADITINEHALSVDLEALGDGQTLQLSTKAGLPAIVSRHGGSLSIELAGEQYEVKVGQNIEFAWVEGGEGEHEMEIIRLADGDGEVSASGKQLKVIRLHGEHDEVVHADGEHKVMVFKRHGEGPIDEAELAALIEEAKAKAGAGADTEDTRITVERRVTRERTD